MKSEHKYRRLKNVSIPSIPKIRIQGNITINKYSRYINLYTGMPIPNNRVYIRCTRTRCLPEGAIDVTGPDPLHGGEGLNPAGRGVERRNVY